MQGEASLKPSFPPQLRLEWTGRAATYTAWLPKGSRNVSNHAAVAVRAVIDPTSRLNRRGKAQSFTVILRDRDGRSALVVARRALRYPLGKFPKRGGDDWAILGAVRLPLASFGGVDLTSIVSLAIRFGRSRSGAIQLTELEFGR